MWDMSGEASAEDMAAKLLHAMEQRGPDGVASFADIAAVITIIAAKIDQRLAVIERRDPVNPL